MHSNASIKKCEEQIPEIMAEIKELEEEQAAELGNLNEDSERTHCRACGIAIMKQILEHSKRELYLCRQYDLLQKHSGRQLAAWSLQNFWEQLAAVEKLSTVGSARLLRLGSNAHFPHKGLDGQGTILVRQCYEDLSQIVQNYFANGGHVFVVIGSPGVGKSLFLCFLMWQLARLGKTVIWERSHAKDMIMFSPTGVFEGSFWDFKEELDNPQTWYLGDGKLPKRVVAKTVFVTSPIWKAYKEALNWNMMQWRYMPPWSWEEIRAAGQHIFPSQLEADIERRYNIWGGIPLFVLQNTSASFQELLKDNLKSCSLDGLNTAMIDPSYSPECFHTLVHMTVEEDYKRGPVVFASEWAMGQFITHNLECRWQSVHKFLAASGYPPYLLAFKDELEKRYASEK